MRTLTLKRKIIILTATLLLMIAGCVAAAVYGLHVCNFASLRVVTAFEVQKQFYRIRSSFGESLMGPHDYLISGNQDKKGTFETDLEKLRLEKDKLKDLIGSESSKAVLESIQVLGETQGNLLTLEKQLSEHETIAGKILGFEEPVGNPKAGSYMEAMDDTARQIEDALEKVEMMFSGLVDETREQRNVVIRRVVALTITFAIIALLAGTTVSLCIMRSITGPIGSLLVATREIIGGNFSARARVERDDEIGQLANHFNTMVQELADTREYLSDIFQCSGDGIRVIDKDLNIVECNMKMEELTGTSGEESLGKKCYEQFSHESCRTEMCTFGRILMGEELIKIEDIKTTKAGQKIPVELVATPLKKEGKIIGVIESFRDISKRQKAKESLQESYDELEQTMRKLNETQAQMLQSEKMASIGQLAAGVGHEINNPTGFVSSNLHTLAGYEKDTAALIAEYRALISGLKEAEEDRASFSEKLDHIAAFEKGIDIDFVLDDIPNLIKESLEGTERIKKIVIDLKDFAHPGDQELKYADINQNLDSTLNIVWNELKYNATVTKDYRELPEVRCYPQQLNQVFVNLLVNAAQGIEKEGEIKITTRALDGKVEIKISDTGKGIPEENLSRIFDPFFTTKEVGKGTGLGLNVAYNIIKKHKGTIDVESTVGVGTTFTIRIPTG